MREHRRHSDRDLAEGLTGEWCTFFIFKNYSSTTPQGEKTDSSFEDQNEGQQDKHECGPMDERRMLAVGDRDCEERLRDRDRSEQVAFGSRECTCRSSSFEES